jgi:hypothetical protein
VDLADIRVQQELADIRELEAEGITPTEFRELLMQIIQESKEHHEQWMQRHEQWRQESRERHEQWMQRMQESHQQWMQRMQEPKVHQLETMPQTSKGMPTQAQPSMQVTEMQRRNTPHRAHTGRLSAARLRRQKRALNKMQVTEHTQPSMPRSHIQRSMQEAEAQRNVAPSKAHPGKLATARLQRHVLTLLASSRVKKKRVVQHCMTPL